ncbi:MAG: hypothetical protein B7Z18_10100 [Alishewanella sp. 32-51-5]|nr:MAG: hypothetical protein B7Z18_10100 [Alishewanella sp. 32-51-5]
MLRRLKGHKDVILEAGGENYYPAKGAAPISTLLVLIVTQVLARCIRRLNAPYNFPGARRRYLPVGSSLASMPKTSPEKCTMHLPPCSTTATRKSNLPPKLGERPEF